MAFLVAFFQFLSDRFLSHFLVQILERLDLVLTPGPRKSVAGRPVDSLWGSVTYPFSVGRGWWRWGICVGRWRAVSPGDARGWSGQA